MTQTQSGASTSRPSNSGWIRSSFWKYLGKSECKGTRTRARSNTPTQLSLQTIHPNTSYTDDWTSGQRTEDDVLSQSLRIASHIECPSSARLDAETADSFFAQYGSTPEPIVYPSTLLAPQTAPALEVGILGDVDSILAFVQVAQVAQSRSGSDSLVDANGSITGSFPRSPSEVSQ